MNCFKCGTENDLSPKRYNRRKDGSIRSTCYECKPCRLSEWKKRYYAKIKLNKLKKANQVKLTSTAEERATLKKLHEQLSQDNINKLSFKYASIPKKV